MMMMMMMMMTMTMSMSMTATTTIRDSSITTILIFTMMLWVGGGDSLL